MGRDRWSSRRIVEDCLPIPIEAFRRWGTFSSPSARTGTITWTNSRTGDEMGRIDYVFQKDESEFAIRFCSPVGQLNSAQEFIEEVMVAITSTPCHFGGRRFWFQCRCGKRVGRLYLPPDQAIVGCRFCHNLIHRSAREHDPREYKLARDPIAIAAALDSRKKLSRRLLWLGASCVRLRWARKPRRGIPAIQS
jgi:hypothetical protein